MNLRTLCDGCHKKKFIVKTRKYQHPILGTITSKGILCDNCYQTILKATCTNKKPTTS